VTGPAALPGVLPVMPVLQPDWAPPPGVRAAMSTRAGGVSLAPYDGLNLSVGVGDDPAAVAENRARWAAALGHPPVWLHLVHGRHVLRLQAGGTEHPSTPADAAWTTDAGVVCQVTAADCLPVLFALRDGTAVGAAHAGWRGLAAGVLEATVAAICEGTGAAPDTVQAWLGPCISPEAFEVGDDVLHAFGCDPVANADPRFHSRPRGDGSARWLADLPALATQQLRAAGVQHITPSGLCTVADASRFFSFRRDGRTGRLAAAIWREG
jgi:YfiH family protein